jgi:hypothetical protein
MIAVGQFRGRETGKIVLVLEARFSTEGSKGSEGI